MSQLKRNAKYQFEYVSQYSSKVIPENIIYPVRCCIGHDFGENELTLILRNRILIYCIDFPLITVQWTGFPWYVNSLLFLFQCEQNTLLCPFSNGSCHGEFIIYKSIKTRMDVGVQNSSTFFYVFLGVHKFCGNKYFQSDQTLN